MIGARKRRSCPTLSLRVAPGAEPWAPTPEQVATLACRLTDHAVVDLYPRADLPAVWKARHGRPYDLDPYAFRAWSRDNHAVVFVDDTETPESILWLIVHELAHIDLSKAKLVRGAYRRIPREPGYLTSDAGHEAHPEEQLANLVADQTAPLLGIRPGLNRTWWRRRMQGVTR